MYHIERKLTLINCCYGFRAHTFYASTIWLFMSELSLRTNILFMTLNCWNTSGRWWGKKVFTHKHNCGPETKINPAARWCLISMLSCRLFIVLEHFYNLSLLVRILIKKSVYFYMYIYVLSIRKKSEEKALGLTIVSIRCTGCSGKIIIHYPLQPFPSSTYDCKRF